MARQRTPTDIIEARGGLDQPCRAAKREGEPECDGDIGDAPGYFDELQAFCWEDLKSALYPGTAGSADRFALEMAAVLLAMLRKNPTAVDTARLQRLHTLLSSFGLTPADRSKVRGLQKTDAPSSFAGLLGGKPKLKAVP